MSVKAHVIHTGCRLNQYESAALSAGLGEKGLTLSENIAESDYVVINTCTVTNKADGRNRSHIRKIHKLNPAAKIVVTGCYATTDAEEIKKLPGVYWVVPNVNKATIPAMLSGQPLSGKKDEGLFEYTFRTRKGQARAQLKIQDGCNKSCSYCKIPHARGEARSRSFADSVREAKHLVEAGFKEISLTGVNIGWYKSDEGFTFYDLVSEILSLDGNFLVRVSSIEPPDVNAKFTQLFQSEKMAKFAHVPLQSGSKQILKRMRRGYTPERFKENILQLREQVPDIHVGTDIITGFPSETSAQFEETVQFAQALKFANIHVFPFSKRRNTPVVKLLEKVAETAPDHDLIKEVHGSIIDSRVEALLSLSEKLAAQYVKETAGTEYRAIVENFSEQGIRLTTENYVKCILPIGQYNFDRRDMVMVRYDENTAITEIRALSLTAGA